MQSTVKTNNQKSCFLIIKYNILTYYNLQMKEIRKYTTYNEATT